VQVIETLKDYAFIAVLYLLDFLDWLLNRQLQVNFNQWSEIWQA